MVNLNYEKIINESKDFADRHDQINSFGNGDLWEVVEKKNGDSLQNYVYPLLWLQDGTSGINEKELTFSFNVIVLDQVLNGEVNENFVKSSMHQLLLDYIAYFYKTTLCDVDGNRIAYTIERTATAQSFTEKYDDILTGWNMSVTFKTPFIYNACNIPNITIK